MLQHARHFALLLCLSALGCTNFNELGGSNPSSDSDDSHVSQSNLAVSWVASPRPPLVRLVNNSRSEWDTPNAPSPIPELPDTSDAALSTALAQLRNEIRFADYPFSGCHDRAHVTYLQLAKSLGKDAAAKAWVFGPALMTVALNGTISAPVSLSRWGIPRTDWDYHVATIVRQGTDLKVIDPVLSQIDRPLSLDEWFALMQTPPGSVYAITPGDLYSFNNAGPSEYSGGRLPFNGSFFRYEGYASYAQWLEQNLARDAVAVELVNHPSACPELHQYVLEPQLLVEALSYGFAYSNASCQFYVDMFRTQTYAWTNTIAKLR